MSLPEILEQINFLVGPEEVAAVVTSHHPEELDCLQDRWMITIQKPSGRVKPISYFYTERDCLAALRGIQSYLDR